jgi:hypothetical protein
MGMRVVVIARHRRDAGARRHRQVKFVATRLDHVSECVSRTPDARQHPDDGEQGRTKPGTTIPSRCYVRTARGHA